MPAAEFTPVEAFYRATQTHDGSLLRSLLHPDLVIHTAPGLPLGAGGTFHGPDKALAKVWGAVFYAYDIAPHAETWALTTDGTVVVTGHYRGTARATGKPCEAEFAHLWRVTDGLLSWLHQYTDTARWHQALATP
jgi:ketosteroid isomerase-like protein